MNAQGKNRLKAAPASLASQVARYHIEAVCQVSGDTRNDMGHVS
jgi:hypothetical protein